MVVYVPAVEPNHKDVPSGIPRVFKPFTIPKVAINPSCPEPIDSVTIPRVLDDVISDVLDALLTLTLLPCAPVIYTTSPSSNCVGSSLNTRTTVSCPTCSSTLLPFNPTARVPFPSSHVTMPSVIVVNACNGLNAIPLISKVPCALLCTTYVYVLEFVDCKETFLVDES